MMAPGTILTLWSVRIAGILYVFALAAWLARRPRAARIAWTAGLCCYLIHVATAFGFYHGWSHAAAYQDTARQTAELFGVHWGGGLYFNYVFTVAWAFDAMRVWQNRSRPRWLGAAVHSFMAFMFFNATVVFASGWVRWLGIVSVCGLAAMWFVSGRRIRRTPIDPARAC